MTKQKSKLSTWLSRRHLKKVAPWVLFILWFLIPTGLLFGVIFGLEQSPVDFLSYQLAAEAINNAANPYLSQQGAQEIWLTYHQLEVDVLAGRTPENADTVLSGPYVYPPTLALWLARLNIGAAIFVMLLLFSVYGFGWLWLRSASANAWWLLLIMFSWDVLASYLGGNVELLLLFLTLAAAWLIWRQHGVWAALLIAIVVLIKPFYALFFAAFGLLMLVNSSTNRAKTLRLLLITAGVTIILIGLEIVGWGSTLRVQAGNYLSEALDYQWLVLPLDQQTPMSIWNRTALQGLVNAGMSANMAQYASLGIWLVLLLTTVWTLRNRALNFSIIFALAFVLLYWGRPVGWGLIYLDIVVLVTLWPAFQTKWQRGVLLGIAVALAASHWLALILTLGGQWVRTFTLQSADIPWETWLVLPLCWLLLVLALPRLTEVAVREMKTD
jgi:hypothetical protein